MAVSPASRNEPRGDTGGTILPPIPAASQSSHASNREDVLSPDLGATTSWGKSGQHRPQPDLVILPAKPTRKSPAQSLLASSQIDASFKKTRRQDVGRGSMSARGPSTGLPDWLLRATQPMTGSSSSRSGKGVSQPPKIHVQARPRGPAGPGNSMPTFDATLQALAKQMSNALVEYYRERGVFVGMAGNWAQLFAEADDDDSGRLTLEELDELVKIKLKLNISRYELRALWLRADPNNTGLAACQDFVRMMYRINLCSWPTIDDQDATRCVSTISAAAERWHHAGGNWFKIFKFMDAEGSGRVAFDEYIKFLRNPLPALRISSSALSDNDLKGLWKAMDFDGSMDIGLDKFMCFFRKHGAALSMHRSISSKSEKNRDTTAELAAVEPLEGDDLRAVATQLGLALSTWLSRQGIDNGSSSKLGASSPRLWGNFFDCVRPSGTATRISFEQFEKAVKAKLKCTKITDGKLKSFWRAVDSDGSGEVTRSEFLPVVYRAQLSSWPVLMEDDLARIVRILNAAADRFYSCSGNWYKVFAKIDEDGSGSMEFDELAAFLRRPLPGLGIDARQLTDDDMLGLWRAVDKDESGLVTTKEFTAFMRIHGKAFSMHKKPLQQTPMDEDTDPIPEKSKEEIQSIVHALNKAHLAYWTSQGVHTPRTWKDFFHACSACQKGRLTFKELASALYANLRQTGAEANENYSELVNGVTYNDLRALWGAVRRSVKDGDNSVGSIKVHDWSLSLYRIDIETWPHINDTSLRKVVAAMDAAADKWHNASGNWYKVFRIVDCDKSGALAFDELHKIVRSPLPCLGISRAKISDDQLRGLWRAMDADMSSEVTIQEFMVFMRKHATKHLHSPLSQKKGKANSRSIGNLNADELSFIAKAINQHSIEKLIVAYRNWSIPWSGSISEWELPMIVRKFFGLDQAQFDDDAVHTLWSSIDHGGTGRIEATSIFSLGKELAEALVEAPQPQ